MKRENVMQKIKTELMLTDAQKPAFHSTHEGFAVLKEEVDELWDEIKLSKSFSANLLMVNEAVQVAAMAIKFIENLYHVDSVDSDLKFEDSRKLSYESCAKTTYHPF